MTEEEKQTIKEATYRTIILNLSDSLLRLVIDPDTTYKVWVKLDPLYLSRDLSNKTYVRENKGTEVTNGDSNSVIL